MALGTVAVIKGDDDKIVAVFDADATGLTALATEYGTGFTSQVIAASAVTAYFNRNELIGLVATSGGAIQHAPALSQAQQRTIMARDRRETVRAWVQLELEQSPFLFWDMALGEARITSADSEFFGHSNRVANLISRAKMIGLAAQTNANLYTAARWGVIERELEFDVFKWYADHAEGSWNTARTNMKNTWYSTSNDSNYTAVSAATISTGVTITVDHTLTFNFLNWVRRVS